MSHFGICKYADGLAALARLEEVVFEAETDPLSTYQPYTDTPGTNTLGVPIKAGLPVASWAWDWLPQADAARLADYEGSVYLRTDTREGGIRKFKTFSGTMLELERGDHIISTTGIPFFKQCTGPIAARFVNLVEV